MALVWLWYGFGMTREIMIYKVRSGICDLSEKTLAPTVTEILWCRGSALKIVVDSGKKLLEKTNRNEWLLLAKF